MTEKTSHSRNRNTNNPVYNTYFNGDTTNTSSMNSNDDDSTVVDIDQMIQNMSITDLIGQMSQIDICKLLYANASSTSSASNDDDDDDVSQIVNQTAMNYYIGTLGVGSVYNFIERPAGTIPWTATTYRSIMVQIQQTARLYNRPPVLWGLDSIHGANFIYNTTVSPQPINLAATFNISTAYHVGQVASRDTRTAGIQWLFTPLVGLGVEVKWSRLYETFGEDPLLVGMMASSMIQGIQQYDDDFNTSDNKGNNATAIPTRAAACAKHYIGYSKPNNGRDRSPSWIPTRHLFQYFVPPWQRVISTTSHGGVLSVMESYTETDGVPMVTNTNMLNTLLRHRLNFTGVLLTDFQELEHLLDWHHVAYNMSDAISYALSQGSVDVSMIPFDTDSFASGMQLGIQTNRFTINRLRESVRRVLNLKMELRMFHETITTDNNHNAHLIGTDEATMLDTVHQSIILVQNKNNVLPLSGSYGNIHDQRTNILITGPASNSRIYQSGGWNGHWQGAPDEQWFTYGSSVYTAFARRQSTNYNASYSCGTDIMGQNCNDNIESPSSIEHAVEASQYVDIVIVCLGEESYAEKPGDLVDDDLHLPDGQYNLVKAIASNKRNTTKILLVYFGGRPRLLGSIVDIVDVVIIGFLPGPSAGDAIVNIVGGAVNPSGRLSITYPATNVGGYPYYHTMSDQCVVGSGNAPHYEYSPCTVQWPFGHGLSYTTFQYSHLLVQRHDDNNRTDNDLHVTVLVKNVGTVPGAEAVLIFTFDEYRRTTPEYKRLRAFEKVFLQPNEELLINVTIPAEDLRFVGPHDDHHYISDSQLSYWVGIGASTDCRNQQLHANGEINNDDDDDSSMCVYVPSQTSTMSQNIAACDASCDIWINQSGCSDHFRLSYESCIDMCTSINENPIDSSSMIREGWGWNYVNCLESVVVGFQYQQNSGATTECWKMTSLCRDIFHSQNLDEFGVGLPAHDKHTILLPSVSVILALLAGLVSTSFMCYSLRPRRTRNERQLSDTQHNRATGGTDDVPYQRLEDLENERDRQLLANTISLLGLD